MFDPLPDDVAEAIGRVRPQLGPYADVMFVEECESTNDLALALATAGRPEGTSVLSDVQRSGRGRRGRAWHSPAAAGLYLSVIVRPATPDGSLPFVTLAAGVAAAEAIAKVSGLPLELKWPNDLVIGRPWRKMGGILAEAVTSRAGIDAVVIGIGINLMHRNYPLAISERATSIEAELGRPIERAPILIELLRQLHGAMALIHSNQHDRLCQAWRRFGIAGLAGQPVRWNGPAGARRGAARDIDHDGALLVEIEGRVERVIAGEVTWERLSRE